MSKQINNIQSSNFNEETIAKSTWRPFRAFKMASSKSNWFPLYKITDSEHTRVYSYRCLPNASWGTCIDGGFDLGTSSEHDMRKVRS